MSEIDFWEVLAEGGNPIAKRNLEEFKTDERSTTNDERSTPLTAQRTTNEARRTKHKAQSTLHDARRTKHKAHCTMHEAH